MELICRIKIKHHILDKYGVLFLCYNIRQVVENKKFENKYYNNFNRETGEYSNPEVSTEQINLIDTAIQELKYKSK